MTDQDKILKAFAEQSLKNQTEIIDLLKSMDWKLWETLQLTKGSNNGSNSPSVARE